MANSVRGEVGFKAAGKTFTLLMSINALCELEGELDMKVEALGAAMQGGADLVTVRAIFWAALQDHHPDLDLKAAGKLMTDLGLEASVDLIGKAFAAAFPDKVGAADAGASGPRKARPAGTGSRS